MSKICKNCETINEDKFSYCKNCGAPLDATENRKENAYSGYNYNPNANYAYTYNNPIPNEIDGVPSEEIGLFVRSNRQKILDKFAKISITGSKLSWCWPAAVLSLLFGFFGAAIWLFYRKMHKYGFIALCVAIIITSATVAITYPQTTEFIAQFLNAFYELKGATPNFQEFSQLLENSITQFASSKEIILSNFINEITTYCATIIYGLFGIYIYKQHTIEKIKEYRALNNNSAYYDYGLQAIGGTSSGMAVLMAIIMLVIKNLLATLPFISIMLLS